MILRIEKRLSVFLVLILFLSGILLSCQSKSSDTVDNNSEDSIAQAEAPHDTIVSFEALFAPGQYNSFLSKYWNEECNNKWYSVAKALSMNLNCPCSGILPTIANNTLTVSLNNINCYPPEVDVANYRVEHQISLPLETLRPYLNEAGKRLVFESGTNLQDWLAKQKKAATAVKESPYTLYVSLILAGKGFRVVLQSTEGPNDQETISGYYELQDSTKIEVRGYRIWGGFVVYDRAKGATDEQLQFSWENEARGEETSKVKNRYLTATSQKGDAYVQYVKLIGDFAQYEGPEDAYREPENGVDDLGN